MDEKMKAVADTAKAAKEIIPVAAQNPQITYIILISLFALAVIALAAFVIYHQMKERKDLTANHKAVTDALNRQVVANEKQAITLEAQGKQLDQLMSTVNNLFNFVVNWVSRPAVGAGAPPVPTPAGIPQKET